MRNKSKSEVNVLFTSVGRRVELLRMFRKAYEDLELDGRIIGVDIDPLAPALRVTDRAFIVPRLDSPDFIGAISGICRQERISVVFPLIDPDVPVLAGHRKTIEETGSRLAVIPDVAVPIVTDKWRTLQFFKDLGLSVPDSWLASDMGRTAPKYPLFVKPRSGSAGKDSFKVNCDRDLAFFAEYVPNALIQEFLPGPEITNDVVCDLDGTVLGVVSRQRIEVRWGEVAKGMTVYHPGIADACTKVAKALPAIGPITVQCIFKGDRPYFTEINARVGGGLPLGIAAGVNSPRLLLARVAGLPVDPVPPGAYQTGLYLTRYDDSFFLDESEVRRSARGNL